MWVPLVENNEHLSDGANYFIEKHVTNILSMDPQIDALLLACTHYPLLQEKITKYLPAHVQLISQGGIVAYSLKDYLVRHPEIESTVSKKGHRFLYNR